MRIIAGEFRRRQLVAPPGFATRPIPDRVKESLFSLLRGHIEGASFVDVFAGSGAVGLEALSRGARSVLFVERDRSALRALEANIDSLAVRSRCDILRGDALGPALAARCPRPANIIFLDPPYPLVREPSTYDLVRRQAAELAPLLAPDGFLILRTPWPHRLDADPFAPPPAAPNQSDPASPASIPPPARARSRRKHRRDPPRSWDWRAALEAGQTRLARSTGPAADADDEFLDHDDGSDSSSSDAPARASSAPSVPADPSIPGLLGPETHPYGKTAVHFYARPQP